MLTILKKKLNNFKKRIVRMCSKTPKRKFERKRRHGEKGSAGGGAVRLHPGGSGIGCHHHRRGRYHPDPRRGRKLSELAVWLQG